MSSSTESIRAWKRVGAAVVVGMLCALGVNAALAPAAAATTAVPRPDHVVVVVEENRAGTQIVGSPDAPYISSLAADGANFTASFAVAHPSEPNYLALFSGSTQGLTDDSCPHSYATPSLGDEAIAAGVGFVGYSEDQPSSGYLGCASGGYARKHNPWSDFPAIPAASSQPFTAFPTDYSTLPAVSFVVPNLTHDMHDGTIAQGDAWLQSNLSGYATWAQTHNSLLIVTFDEDDSSASNRIATIFSGQRVAQGTYAQTITHYDVLRTLTDAYGLPSLGSGTLILNVWTPDSGNQPPTARFTAPCTGRDCALDGSASSDPDGTIADYSWNFGDGSTGNGPTVSHTYAISGTYVASLTVTDAAGSSSSVSHSVSAISPGASFASDVFGRTLSSGWGSADVGGAWALSGAASAFSVASGLGSMKLAKAGALVGAVLSGVARTDADVVARVRVDAVPVGGPVYLTVQGRRVSAGNEYAAKVLVYPDRSVMVRVSRSVGGVETGVMGPVKVAGLVYSAGLSLDVRVQAVGVGPTVVRARVWVSGSVEPSVWPVSGSDAAAGLQVPGAVGVGAYLSGSATNAPLSFGVSSITARPSVTVPPPPNQAPTAAFTSSCTQLSCALSGSGSSDPDGSVAGWAWDFGDTSTGSGATVSHNYAAAGDYTVALTVTDNQGATAVVTHVVTATVSPPPPNQAPSAAFTSSCLSLSCSFDGTTSTDDQAVTGWAWNFGDGSTGSGRTVSHSYAQPGTYSVILVASDSAGLTGTVSKSVAVTSAAVPFASDVFGRTLSSGWGSADVGGAWALSGAASAFSVASGLGSMKLAKAGALVGAVLSGVARTDADVVARVRVDAVPVGGPVYLTVQGRRVSAGNEYAAKVLVYPDRSVMVRVSRSVGGVETGVMGPVKVAGLVYSAGLSLDVRVQAVGVGPTVVRARVWVSGSVEPSVWPVSGSDAAAGLQVPGAVGVGAYLSGSATNAPLMVGVASITAKPTSTG